MFEIPLYNSFRFAKRDDLLPNFFNQLHSEREQVGFIIKQYCSLIQTGEERTIQIWSDYDGAITATLINNTTNAETALVVTKKNDFPNAYIPFSSWEFTNTFNEVGSFSIRVNGADSVQDAVVFLSEPIDVQVEHKYTLLMKYYNGTNTSSVDYSTGIKHYIRVVARIPDSDDETDENIYDNQNKKTKTYSATAFAGAFTTDPIPEYLIRQIGLAQGLFEFYINDVKYTASAESFTPERFGQTTSKQLALNCTEYDSYTNTDDSTPEETPTPSEDMNTYPLNLEGVSGSQQLTIAANYMLDNLMFVLVTGTSASVKVGTTVGGDEVISPKTINTAKPVYTIDREYLASLAQYENAFIIYITITGVGATLDVNAIIKRYKDE